jgi:hypothetical protein
VRVKVTGKRRFRDKSWGDADFAADKGDKKSFTVKS